MMNFTTNDEYIVNGSELIHMNRSHLGKFSRKKEANKIICWV
jgi:hypothetical protein